VNTGSIQEGESANREAAQLGTFKSRQAEKHERAVSTSSVTDRLRLHPSRVTKSTAMSRSGRCPRRDQLRDERREKTRMCHPRAGRTDARGHVEGVVQRRGDPREEGRTVTILNPVHQHRQAPREPDPSHRSFPLAAELLQLLVRLAFRRLELDGPFRSFWIARSFCPAAA